MYRHRYIRYSLGFAVVAAVGLALVLWRLGLAPLYAYLVSANAITLLLYGYDKRQAIVGGLRVPELVLHLGALCGGSPAALLGQGLFRHKTRKFRFQAVFAAILLLQIVAVCVYWRFISGG
jgi:uncharacterized membrane protein YsdA (DUF1294 family)